MKTLLTISFLMGLCATLFAQTGIYMTYDDFKAGKLIKSDDNTISIKMKHEVSMKVGGVTQTYATKDFYAMLLDGELYRFSPTSMGNIYLKLYMVSDNYAQWQYSESRTTMGSGRTSNTIITYVSNGLGGKMLDITTNGQAEAMAKQSDLKALSDCVKSGKKLSMFNPLSVAVSRCIYDDPTNKKDPKSVIPPIK